MIKLLFSEDELFQMRIARWVMARVFMVRRLRPGDFKVIAVAKIDPAKETSTVIAALLFHDYVELGDGGKVEVSMAADHASWAQPGIVRGLLNYPFVQLNCHVLVATTNKTNKRTRRFLKGMGFIESGMIPNRPYADDTIIYSLRREDASRWLTATEHKEAA